MEKIKILRIITRLNIGGPAIHVVLLASGLDKSRFDSLLVCGRVSQDEGGMHYYANEHNVKPTVIPELRRELNVYYDICAIKKIYQIIKAEKPGIIHTHTAKAGALGRMAAILYNILHPNPGKRILLIHTFHGHTFNGYFNRFKVVLFILIERFLTLFTYKIITVSESVMGELVSLKICPADKIKIIPLGFDLGSFLDVSPKNNDDILNIGIIGRLTNIKNHHLFLDAASRVIKKAGMPELRFRIIGGGQLKDELILHSRTLGLENIVEFFGWQSDLPKVYSDLDIVALTSNNEGTPVSLIEAMACAKTVVATGVGGVPELLGEDRDLSLTEKGNFRILSRGVIVRSRDPDGFAAALALVSKNKNLREKLGLAARNFVSTNFTKERLIKNIEELYLEASR